MNYLLAKKLKDNGFNQSKKEYALYYINENVIAYFKDIKNAFYAKDYEENRKENIANWIDNFTYIPTLEDFQGIKAYEATLYMFATDWIRNNYKEDLIKRTEDAIKENDKKLAIEEPSISSDD